MQSHSLIKGGFFLLCLLAVTACSKGPGSTAKSFMEAIRNGEINDASKLVDAKGFSNGNPELAQGFIRNQLSEGSHEIEKEGMHDLKVIDEIKRGDEGQVTLEWRTDKDKKRNSKLKLVRTEQGWRISMGPSDF